MKNIPLFTTENGIASLTLQEIPHTQKAYICLQSSTEPEKLFQECVDFCRAVGADRIYATGHSCLEAYPLQTVLLQMQRPKAGLPETDACLFPAQENTMEQFRNIYNEKMKNISNAAFLSTMQAKEILKKGSGYFVHRNEELLGIGIASGNTVEAVIALVPGVGPDVLLALTNALFSEDIFLEVASDNIRAIRLYEKLGFIKTKEISRWYKIFENVK